MKKSIDQLIAKFNQPDVHLVVSEWPTKEKGRSYHGVASFTKEMLMVLAQNQHMRFVVLAEKDESDNMPEVLLHGRILVLRVFDHKHPTLYPVVLAWLHTFSAIKHITVHSEFGVSSGIKHFLLLLPFLAIIKLSGRSVSYFAHNIIQSFASIAKHINVSGDQFVISLLDAGLPYYYKLLALLTNKVVILDQHLYAQIQKYIPEIKLYLSPHFVKKQKITMTKNAAKKTLGIDKDTTLLMSFGFLSWYKGSDIFAKLFAAQAGGNKKFHLIFAGGPRIGTEGNKEYERYLNNFLKLCRNHSNITVTGFVPDNKLSTYFQAADLVTLPYRGLMGGSGTLAQALGFHKPFLISNNMSGIWENADFTNVINQHHVPKSQLMFDLNSNGMKKILSTAKSQKKLNMLARIAQDCQRARDIEKVCQDFYNDIYEQDFITSQRAPAALALTHR